MEIYELPAFEVKETKNSGYFAKKSVAGSKTAQDLADMASNIVVVPRDLIDDIGAFESASDTLKFVASGVNPFVRGEQMQIRGSRTTFTRVDDIPDLSFFADNANIDTYEVLKGPQGLLYGASSGIFGLVVKTTKRPQSQFSADFSLSVGDYGWTRLDADITGPLSRGFSYRIVAASQKSDGFNSSYRDNRKVFIPTLQWTNGKTTIRATYDWHQIETGSGDAANVIDNRGPELVQYASPKGKNFRYGPDWSKFGNYFNVFGSTLTHRWNENWETRIFYTAMRGDRPSIDNIYVGSIDWATKTLKLDYFDYDENFYSSVYGTDNIGKYKLGKVDLQSNFGYNFDTRKGASDVFTYTPGFLTTNLDNPIDFSTVRIPTSPKQKSYNYRQDGRTDTAYLLETATFLDNRLIVNAGYSYIKATNSDSPANDTNDSAKRAGIVIKPVQNVSVYWGYATMFQATSSTTIGSDGKRLPNRSGEGNEFGVKASLFGGKLAGTVDYYSTSLTGSPMDTGLRLADGRGYYISLPKLKYKGVEADLQLQLTKNWQMTAVAWNGEVHGSDGKRASRTRDKSFGLYTRYNFAEGAMKGWHVGGGVYNTGIEYWAGGKSFPGYTVANFFAGYRYNENLSYKLHVNNVFDEQYIPGSWSRGDADVGDPRMIRLSVKYSYR